MLQNFSFRALNDLSQGDNVFGRRFRAAGIHLAISAIVGGLAAALVFGLWYPWPYRSASGGQNLFILLVSVDLVLGPALTLVVFNTRKSRSVLIHDLAVIAAFQMSGLMYGLHIVFLARPVAMVFEGSRFRIVSYVDVVSRELPNALAELRALSVTGPKLLGTRQPRNGAEKYESIQLALQGVDIGTRPSYWQPYRDSRNDILTTARPLSILLAQYASRASVIEQEIKRIGYSPLELKFLPIISKQESWSALLDAKTGEVVGFLQYAGFF